MLFEYTICNRVARSLFGIGDQAETCAQLFYVKERFYGFEKTLTFDEQVDKLAAHGMIITDRGKAKDVLKRVNYYRFTGYALQFRRDPSGSDYIVGTTFETVY